MRCVVQGCSNTSNHRAGISLHCSPVSKSERDKWVRFVKTHRANFTPQGRFVICSDHFEDKCFERRMHVEGFRRRLLPASVPRLWKKSSQTLEPSSARSRRKVSTCDFYLTFSFAMRSLHVYIIDFSALLCAWRIAVVSYHCNLCYHSRFSALCEENTVFEKHAHVTCVSL